jgi:hypothetical protein
VGVAEETRYGEEGMEETKIKECGRNVKSGPLLTLADHSAQPLRERDSAQLQVSTAARPSLNCNAFELVSGNIVHRR